MDQRKRRDGDSICAVLQHPIRPRILEVLNEVPKSGKQYVEEGLLPAEYYESYDQALSLVAYHFRELAKHGCIELIDTHARRGGTEKIYRGVVRLFFTDEEFEAMPQATRRGLSRTTVQGMIARMDSALQADTFDSRTDRHLTWMPMSVDPRGWDEAMAAMAACFGKLEQIREDSRDRLAGSCDEVIPMTVGIVGFESPPPARLTSASDSAD
jgi:hypothetical protein